MANHTPIIWLESRKQLEAVRLAVQRELYGRDVLPLKTDHQQAYRETLKEVNGILNPFSFFLDNEEPQHSAVEAEAQETDQTPTNSAVSESDARELRRRQDELRQANRRRHDRERKAMARRKAGAEQEMKARGSNSDSGRSPYVVRRTGTQQYRGKLTAERIIKLMVDWFERFNELPQKSDWSPYNGGAAKSNPDRPRRFEEAGGRTQWPTPSRVEKIIDWDQARQKAEERISG